MCRNPALVLQSMMCEDINECTLNPSLCGPGRCVNTAGGYECQCPRDYMLAPDGQQCVDMRKEVCFMKFSRENCSAPMSQPQTRLVCCCSMGAGWGRQCEQCPTASSSAYTELCGGGGPGQIVDPITGDLTEIDECKMMQVGTSCLWQPYSVSLSGDLPARDLYEHPGQLQV